VREVRDAVDVARPRDRRDEDLDAFEITRLQGLQDPRQQLALVPGQVRMEVLREQLLLGAVAEAPGQRLGVALSRCRVGEGAGVLVDAEREGRCLERRDRDLALGEDADERCR
jgi:hypothetical protein